jgi:acyl carrier protein
MERSIAAIWREVLHLEKVGVDDSFFSLGGHSLNLVQVQSQLAKLVHFPLIMMDLFRYPTISSLARHLSERGASKAPPADDFGQKTEIQVGKGRLNQRLKLSQQQKELSAVRKMETGHE